MNKKKIVYCLLCSVVLLCSCPSSPHENEEGLLLNSEIKSVGQVIRKMNSGLNEMYVDSLASEIVDLSSQYDIPKDIIITIVAHESSFDPFATNPRSNATGLGQIIPKWWGEKYNFTNEDLFNWKINLGMTVKILKELRSNYGHRSNWIVNYYSRKPSVQRLRYYNEWKRKNRYVRYLLVQGD